MNLCLMIKASHFISADLFKYSTFMQFIFTPLGTFKVNLGEIIQKLFSFITGKFNYIQNLYFIYLFTFFICIENMQADFQNVAYKEIYISMTLEILIDWPHTKMLDFHCGQSSDHTGIVFGTIDLSSALPVSPTITI